MRWVLSESAASDTTQFVHNLERISQTIDTIVGKNYVPAYPSYVLAILQATEAGTEIDLHASTHGYLYELFIKSTIAKRASATAFNVICAYMAHIAHWMFTKQQKHITLNELRTLHDQLHTEYEVLSDFDRQTNQLIDVHLVSLKNDCISFRHPYIYYYFIALYLRDHLAQETVKATIATLSKQLHRDDSANTLLFLAHLSKDESILESLLAAAAGQYVGAAETALEEDVAFLNQLGGVVNRLQLPDRPVAETREEELESLEAARHQELEFEVQRKAEIENDSCILGRLNAALKTIQILGQFLKNFPANLDRTQKDRIIAACSTLARKGLGDFLGLVQRNETAMLEEILFLISRRKPGIAPDKLRDRATTAVVALCELATTGMIQRLSYAIGSSELSTTYERLLPKNSVAIMRLLYLALRLDHYQHFPEGLIDQEVKLLSRNPFAFRILRCLIVRHFAIFPTDFRLKQRLSSVLELDYQKISIARDELKLLKDRR